MKQLIVMKNAPNDQGLPMTVVEGLTTKSIRQLENHLINAKWYRVNMRKNFGEKTSWYYH